MRYLANGIAGLIAVLDSSCAIGIMAYNVQPVHGWAEFAVVIGLLNAAAILMVLISIEFDGADFY
jgi:hypothetical protein